MDRTEITDVAEDNEISEETSPVEAAKMTYVDTKEILDLAVNKMADGQTNEAKELLARFLNTDDISHSYIRVSVTMARELAMLRRDHRNWGAAWTLVSNIRDTDDATDFNSADVAAALETLMTDYRFDWIGLANLLAKATHG